MRAFGWLAIALVGCGEDPKVFLEFGDLLVEARARSVLSQSLEGSCGQTWAVAAAQVTGLPSVRAQHTRDYPLRPTDIVPEGDLEDGVLHVGVRDADGLTFARGCTRLPQVEDVTLALRGLPECTDLPTALDVAVVFDGSADMAMVDTNFGGVARVFREGFVASADFPSGSRFSLYTFGPQTAATVSPVGAAVALADGVDALAANFDGGPDLFSAITLAARQLRDRAVCGLRPVLVVVAAGRTEEVFGRAISFDAAFSLFAAQGVRGDDIFAFGVALSQGALEDLGRAIPETVGEIRGARTEATLRNALAEASFAIRQRLN